MLASPNAGGQKLWVDIRDLGGGVGALVPRNVMAIEPEHTGLHHLEINRPAPLFPRLTLCGLN